MKTLRSSTILFAVLAILMPMTSAQTRQRTKAAGAAEPAKPKSVTHNGHPALEFDGPDGWGFFVVLGPHQGEPSLGFAVAQGDCQGMVYVTRTRVTGDFRNTRCENFDVARQGSTAERQPGKVVVTSGSSKYELTPQGERDTQRHAIRAVGTGAEFLLRAINNFDGVFRNFRHMAMEAQAQAQTITPPTAAAAKTAAADKPAALLTIMTDPGDVQVYVNDEPRGMTSADGREVLHLAPGSYRVRMSLPGYKDSEQQVTLAPAKAQEITAKLEIAGPPAFKESDITEMLQGKMSAKRISTLVEERGVDFALNSDVEKHLRNLGATSDLLLVIAEHKK